MKVCNVSAMGLCLTMWSSSQVTHIKMLVKDRNVVLALLIALVRIGFKTAKTKHIHNHKVHTQNCFGKQPKGQQQKNHLFSLSSMLCFGCLWVQILCSVTQHINSTDFTVRLLVILSITVQTALYCMNTMFIFRETGLYMRYSH